MLLDTHTWIWFFEGDAGHLGPRTRRLLDRAGNRRQLHVSTVSIFELASLYLAGRIRLARPVETWLRESIEQGDLRLTELTAGMAIDGGLIPPAALPDPIDRLLIATARRLDLPLVTRDRRVLDYGRTTGQVRTIDAAE